MSLLMSAPNARENQARARFETLRRRVFEDMARSSARWRLTWVLPYHGLVILLLVAHGESVGRALAQATVVAILGVLLAARVLWTDWRLKVGSFVIGVGAYFVLLATTGGLSSPLLVSGALMMMFAAVTLRDPHWLRHFVFALFLLGFVALAVLSRSAAGALDGPLAVHGTWASADYVTLALMSTVLAMVGIYGFGCTITRGYERAALELAERREELCSENADRTRELEGMAARLAHEVKNPLAAIKALSTHMARNASDGTTAERLGIVAAEADRLQSIVDGFLSFSRGLDDLNLAQVKPHEVVRELSVLLESRASEAGVTIDVAGDANLEVAADARKLRQALLNIVLNAIEASPQGAKVKVDVAAEAGGARIHIHDDGVGMTPEVLDRIRKPYFTTKQGGSGLGVAVARGLIEQHGGRVEFKSASGKGTMVVIFLPTKAKPCARLPNPFRSLKQDGDADPAEPAALGAR